MKKVRVVFVYLFKKKQVLLKSKSLPLKTIRVLQRILTICVKSKELSTASHIFAESRRWRTAVFYWGAHFLEPTCLPKKRIPFLQKHRILATMLMTQDVPNEEIISSFWENIYFELFSFSIKRAARRGCDTFTHKKLRVFFVLFYILFGRKKNRPCFRKLSTVFPNIPFAECGRYDFTFVFNIARKQIIGGDCAALYAY